MAKKPSRSGGRVTPKGTQPPERTTSGPKAQPALDHRIVNRFDPAQHQRSGGPSTPTRAGHHRGQR
jgi:hypothetical protein